MKSLNTWNYGIKEYKRDISLSLPFGLPKTALSPFSNSSGNWIGYSPPGTAHICSLGLKSWSLRTKTYWDLRHIKKEWYRYAISVHFKAFFRNMLHQWKWCRHLTALRQRGNAGYRALETLYNFSPVLKCGKCKLVWSINGDNLLEIAGFYRNKLTWDVSPI